MKTKLNLSGSNGHPSRLVSEFIRKADKAGWTFDEIQEVVQEAKSGDYDHMVKTFREWCHSCK